MAKRPVSCMMLSLQEMAFRTVAVDIWNKTVDLFLDEDFRSRFYNNPSRKPGADVEIEIIEGMVKDKVLKLMIPDSLKKRMMFLVRPIGTELLNWRKLHKAILRQSDDTFYTPLLHHLCWLSTGVIDYGATAERLSRLESLDIEKRYEFACTYCLVDSIPNLWEMLSEETRKHYYELFIFSPWSNLRLGAYWAYALKGKEYELDIIVARRFGQGFSFNRYAFAEVSSNGNKMATEYFFKKLTGEERRVSLSDVATFILSFGRPTAIRMRYSPPKEKLTDVLFYILGEMLDEERIHLMSHLLVDTFACYFDWSWQDALLDFAALNWEFLSEDDCYRLVHEIHKVIRGPGYYLPDEFQQFFVRSPDRFKTVFATYECERADKHSGIFQEFFEAEDKETIGIIFGAIDVEDRRKLVSTHRFLRDFRWPDGEKPMAVD